MGALHKSIQQSLRLRSLQSRELTSFIEAAAGAPVFTRDGAQDTRVANIRRDITAVVLEPVCATVLMRDGMVRHLDSREVFA